MKKNGITQKNNTNKLLQQETSKIIKESLTLLTELIKREEANEHKNSKKTLSLKNLKEHQNILTNELQKLNNLEYVIAFVGTMKSGKSMTINAIVGQEILPSREFPMTTLPTLITHKPNQTEPILTIKKVAPFNKLVKEIQTKLKDHNNLSNLQEIQDLVNKIKSKNIKLETKYEGQENISKFLKEINDLMRVAKELNIEPSYDQYTDVDDLPRIEVEFYHLKKYNKVDSTAKLTLLDTPGPDEVKQSTLLKKIFQEQLKRASAVTLVVDYTKMNNESDAEVKEQVKDVANMIGKKHLFVLLNKFDQRNQDKDETESREEAKRLIYDDILKGKINKENVYPISSKSAFYANRGLCELDKNGKIYSDLPWRKSFGVEVLGRRWEKYINDNEEVIEACNETWKDSFFEEPLNNIIETVHREASMLVLDAPLGKIKTIVDEVEKALKIKTNALTMKIQTLQENIDEIKNKIDFIEEISSKLKKNINAKSKENSKNINNEIDSYIKRVTDKFSKESDKKTTDEINKTQETSEKAQIITIKPNSKLSWLNTTLWEGGLLGGTTNKDEDILKLKELKEKGEIRFKKKDDALKFLHNIKEPILKELQNLPKEIGNETNKNIVNLSNQINEDIKQEMGKLIKEISKKLGENIYIDLPQLDIKYFDIKINMDLNNNIETKTVTYKEKGDDLFNSILYFFNRNWGLEEKKEKSYSITQEKINEVVGKELNFMRDKLKENVETTYKKNIQEKVERFLQKFIKNIKGYQEEQKEVLKNRQNERINENKEISRVNHFLSLTQKISKRREVTQNILHKDKKND